MPATEAVLIVRAWFERGHSPDFRARLLGVHLDDPEATRVATTPDEVMEIVRFWLDTLLHAEAKARENRPPNS